MQADFDIPHPHKLLEQVVDHLRVKHYSLRTEKIYVDWIKRFIWFHGKRHPKEMGAPEVEAFLTHLAVERSVSASTQNQAKSALLFLYKEVLGIQLPWLDNVTQHVARKRRSGIRGFYVPSFPDFIALHPGYAGYAGYAGFRGNDAVFWYWTIRV